MRLIVGLGNPGKKYDHTRHNVGFDVLDVLYDRLENASPEKFVKGSAQKGLLKGEKVMLLKPLTYMNLSGEALQEASAYYKIPPEDIIVICDDIDLPPGYLRIREKGGPGGHNGLKNIIDHLHTQDFVRIRLGIGDRADKRQDLADHVLGHFAEGEADAMEKAMEHAADAVECMITDGISIAMNRFNTKKEKPAKKKEEETDCEP